MIDTLREIERLVRFERRAPGSDAERRAANHLKERLEALGRDARLEATSILPRWALAHALHAAVAVVGSGVAVVAPLAGAIVVAVAALSALAEITATAHVASRLTGRRASQNVVSEERSIKPGTLILTAHYDAGRSALWFARGARRSPFPVFAVALLVALGCAIARVAGASGSVLAVVQFVPTVVLILSVPLLLDNALSGTVPGANDNASGVATVMRLAERYGAALEHFDLWVVLPGAGEAGAQGMRAWMKRHRKGLEPVRTVLIDVDEVGAGSLRYLTREGPLLTYRYHPQIVALCDRLRDERDHAAARMRRRGTSSARVARTARLPTVGIRGVPAPEHHRHSDTPERIDEGSLDRAFEFCAELVELIDERLGPALPERPAEAFSSA